jgi:hypothetical protein
MGSFFWDITPCSPLRDNQCFRGTRWFHLQSRIINQARNHHESGRKKSWFLAWIILPHIRWREHVPPKRLLTFKVLHGVIPQKKVPFISTTVRTSNPIQNKVKHYMKTNHDLKCICLFNTELSTSSQLMYVCMCIMYINIHQLIHQRKASSFVIKYQFS